MVRALAASALVLAALWAAPPVAAVAGPPPGHDVAIHDDASGGATVHRHRPASPAPADRPAGDTGSACIGFGVCSLCIAAAAVDPPGLANFRFAQAPLARDEGPPAVTATPPPTPPPRG